MADEHPKEQGETSEIEEVNSDVSLSDASKSGFNNRAWNDPPPLLLNTAAVQAALQAHKDSPSRPKLAGRVAYPMSSPTPAPSMVLNPNGPPPRMGFINAAGSSPKGPPPRSAGNHPRQSSGSPPPQSAESPRPPKSS